jgi:hypothetical protein
MQEEHLDCRLPVAFRFFESLPASTGIRIAERVSALTLSCIASSNFCRIAAQSGSIIGVVANHFTGATVDTFHLRGRMSLAAFCPQSLVQCSDAGIAITNHINRISIISRNLEPVLSSARRTYPRCCKLSHRKCRDRDCVNLVCIHSYRFFHGDRKPFHPFQCLTITDATVPNSGCLAVFWRIVDGPRNFHSRADGSTGLRSRSNKWGV